MAGFFGSGLLGAAFGPQEGDQWMNPDRQIAMRGIGQALSALGAGQPVDTSAAYAALQERKDNSAFRKQIQETGILDQFTPQQRAILAQMPPKLAQDIIMKAAFAEPKKPDFSNIKEIDGRLIDMNTMTEVYSSPDGSNDTTSIQEYKFAQGQGFAGTFQEFEAAKKGSQQPNSYQEYSLTDPTPTPEEYDAWLLRNKGAGATRLNFGGFDENGQPIATAGRNQLDKDIAADLISFMQGGAADAAKNISQLETVVSGIKSGSSGNVSGPGVGLATGLPLGIGDAVGSIFFPKALDAKEQVAEVVQRNLKAILGAQFTAKEGEQLILRAFNPSLDESVNSKRLDRLVTQMKLAYAAKKQMAEYFAENGTMTGYDGYIPKIEDFSVIFEGQDTGNIPTYNKETGQWE